MKVLLTGEYPGKSGVIANGVQASAVVLASELVSLPGIELNILTCRPDVLRPETVEQNGCTIHYLPSSTRAGLLTHHWVDRRLIRKKIAEIRPDVIHANQTGFHALAAIETGRPVVLTVHGIVFDMGRYLFGKGLLGRIRRDRLFSMHRECLRRAKHVITISPHTWDSVGHLSKAETYAIDNPVDRIYFEQAWNPLDDRLLFVGAIMPLKGIDCLLDAFSSIREIYPRLKLEIVGGIRDQAYYDTLLDRIRRDDLEGRVEFTGELPRTKLAHRYSSATALILPSEVENAPIVISEAMAVGCPVIATKVGGIPYMVQEGVTGLMVEPKNPEALSKAILKMIEDDEFRSVVSESGRQEALDRYAPWVVARKVVEVYNRVVQSEKR